MNEEDGITNRGLILETRRDVAWIRETLTELKDTNKKQDTRISRLENSSSKMKGRDSVIVAIIAGGVSLFVTLLSIFSGGRP